MMGDCVNEDECQTGNNDCPLAPIGICIDTHPTQSGYFCDCIAGYTYQPGRYSQNISSTNFLQIPKLALITMSAFTIPVRLMLIVLILMDPTPVHVKMATYKWAYFHQVINPIKFY